MSRIARFGVFDLDPRTGELRKRGVRVRLQEQPFQILTLLLDRAGDLVSRDELRQRLWSDEVFVDFEQGLNNAVAKIRTALGDSAESPRFVETLERRGYRFIGAVEWVETGRQAPSPHHPASPSQPPSTFVRVSVGDKTVPLAEGTHVIGRDPAASVWIDSALVSRQHARLLVRNGHVTIEDLGSRNGTFVNGVRLTAAAALAHGDEVSLGTVQISVHIASGKTATVLRADTPEDPLATRGSTTG
jgi:DNA-binding winged helix-turn-helix (wHTH) protein